jgi:hypothetical protein
VSARPLHCCLPLVRILALLPQGVPGRRPAHALRPLHSEGRVLLLPDCSVGDTHASDTAPCGLSSTTISSTLQVQGLASKPMDCL